MSKWKAVVKAVVTAVVKAHSEIYAYVGSAALLGAYIAASSGYWHGTSPEFYITNGLGASFLMVSSIKKRSFAFTFLNLIWAVIALEGLMWIFLI